MVTGRLPSGFIRNFASRTIVEEPIYKVIWRKFRQMYWEPAYKVPPYDHTCQVGDPVLRVQAAPVDVKHIKSKEIKNLIDMMIKVMRKNRAVGIAAPQIGVSKQVIVVEFSEKHAKVWPKERMTAREASIFPLKVFINPKLKILDERQVTLPEGCLSVKGFYADVPRAYKVEISGYNQDAQPVTWTVQGYPARILQHEVAHLRGDLFLDIMDSRTFNDELWVKWNMR